MPNQRGARHIKGGLTTGIQQKARLGEGQPEDRNDTSATAGTRKNRPESSGGLVDLNFTSRKSDSILTAPVQVDSPIPDT